VSVGILGGGQLAQLLAHAAKSLDIKTLCLCDHKDEPASLMSPILLDDGSEQCLEKFARSVDVITLENENIDTQKLEFLQQFKPVYPGINALKKSQDRLFEKQMFVACNIPTVPFVPIDNEAMLNKYWQQFNENAILKTRRFGYDGKGQARIQTTADLSAAWHSLGNQATILEGFLPFDFEVSLIGARNLSGESVFYPLIRNTHRAGILRKSIAPYQDRALQQQAEQYMQKLFDHLEYVGVLAFEFFVKAGQLYANEIAPRVHNSGHLTLDAATLSQFHLHLLSILNRPLIQPKFHHTAAMLNFIGTLPQKQKILAYFPEAHYYDYGKEARPGRKLGHVTLTTEKADTAWDKQLKLLEDDIQAL
jgi:5-(carboxyamino)imidazole ribonucleotide synthase